MASASGSCIIEHPWTTQNMFTNRRVMAVAVNGKRRQPSDCIASGAGDQEDFDGCIINDTALTSQPRKRHCNGLNGNGIVSHVPPFRNEVVRYSCTDGDFERMAVDEFTHTEVHLKQDKLEAGRVCARCLAGEPGHIRHIVSPR